MIKVWVLIVILQGGGHSAPATFKLTYSTPQECANESRYWKDKQFDGPRVLTLGTKVVVAECRMEMVAK